MVIGRKGVKASHLSITCLLKVGDAERRLKVLIDTGAEYCIVRSGIFPDGYLEMAENPIRFLVANNSVMAGGRRVVNGALEIEGVESDTHLPQVLQLPIQAYEAAIAAEMIV